MSLLSVTADWPAQPGYLIAVFCRSLRLLRPLSGALKLCQSPLLALPRTAARKPQRLLQRPGGELGNLRNDARYLPASHCNVPTVCKQWACAMLSTTLAKLAVLGIISVPGDEEDLKDCWCPQEDWGELYSGKRAPGIFVLDLQMLKVQLLTGTPADSSVGQPMWSPSGAHISSSCRSLLSYRRIAGNGD